MEVQVEVGSTHQGAPRRQHVTGLRGPEDGAEEVADEPLHWMHTINLAQLFIHSNILLLAPQPALFSSQHVKAGRLLV